MAAWRPTLRPTRFSRDPNAKDWTIHEDGAEIGRLYEDLTAAVPPAPRSQSEHKPRSYEPRRPYGLSLPLLISRPFAAIIQLSRIE
jgi:hypothetical protein